MNLSIKYNGYDISSVDLRACILTDRYGGLLDDVKLSINDADRLWAKYGIAKGDEIIIKTDGYTTGFMYVARASYIKDVFSIDAVSLKPTKKIIKSRMWMNVKLTEILNDCATNNGLTLKTYYITDYSYESLAQVKETDIEFVSRICQREGYSVKVDNDCLIVFNEYYMESQSTDLKITPSDVDNNFDFVSSSNCMSSVTVSHYDAKNGLIRQTATDDLLLGGSKIINEKVTSYDEAKRFAYGYLRGFNKKSILAYLSMPYNSNISAGTLFHAEGFDDFDGKYVVIEVSHNVKNEKTRITARKTLDHY